MGSWAYAYQILRVEYGLIRFFHLLPCKRIHVMNDDLVVNIPAFNSEITAIVANDDLISEQPPSLGIVKSLVQKSFKSKRGLSD